MSEAQEAGTANNDAGDVQNADAGAPAVQETVDAAKAADTANVQEAANKDEGKAPESEVEVDYTFEMPEGFELDEQSSTEFKEIAKDLKLPKESAQKLVDIAVKREQARVEAHAQAVKSWGEQVAADKELGTPENLATAKQAIETFGSPELKEMLDKTGLGNHPAVVRMALKIGKAISEDRVITGRDGAGSQPRDPADILYGNPSN